MVASNASVSGSIVSSFGSIGGWTLSAGSLSSGSVNLVSGASAKIYIGAGTYSSSTTPFYVDNSGSLSIGNKLTWNGSRLLIGDQTGGTVGFQAPVNPSASDIAIYAGASAFSGASAAPFRVTYGGVMYATGASVSGSITALAGNIGGWIVNSNSLTSANVGLYAPTSPASSEIAFFAGSAVASRASAAFRVDYSGNLYAQSANIYGTINGLTVGFGGINSSSTNTALGSTALKNADSTSLYNVGIGASSLYTTTGGDYNVAVGYQALALDNIGSYNTAIGFNALKNNTSGNNNLGIGYLSLLFNDSGSYNVAIGDSTLSLNTSGQRNVALGYAAVSGNKIGNYNIGIGSTSLSNSASNSNNIAIGTDSLYSASLIASNNNVAAGYQTGRYLEGNDNVLLGTQAGLGSGPTTSISSYNVYVGTLSGGNTNGSTYNVGVGYQSLASITNGTNNVAIGSTAASALTSGINNVALGSQSLKSNTIGSNNLALGTNALSSNTTGSNNFAIGNYSLASNISSTYNVAIGASALGAYANISIFNNGQNTAIGYAAMQSTASAYSNIALGPYSLAGNPSINNNHGQSNIAIGDHALFWTAANGATNNVAIGTYSFGSQIVSSSTVPNTDNVAIGSYALYGQGYSVSNVAIGANALFGTNNSLYNLRGSYYSVAVGANALQYDSQAAYSVAIGNNAFQGVGINLMNSYNNNSIAIGAGAGGKTHGVQNSVLIGTNAGNEVGSPVGNIATDLIALGNGALLRSYESSYNIGIGISALNNSPSTTYNIAVGSYSMSTVSASATRNIAMGQYSLNSLSGTSSGNIAIGYQAMVSSSTVNNNVAIGYQVLSASVPAAPFTGSSNVAIGNFVGNGASSMYETVAIGNNIGSNVKNMGSKNVYIGSNVLVNYPATASALNTYNVAVGYQALSNASAGVTNSVGIGPFSLQNITSGDKNIAIGYAAGPTTGALSNTIAIGDSVAVTQNGQIIIGGPSSTASATQIAGASVNLGAWIPYTPTCTSAATTLGATPTYTGAYTVIGKTVHWRAKITFGPTGFVAGTGNFTISLPIAISPFTANQPIGIWFTTGPVANGICVAPSNGAVYMSYSVNSSGTPAQNYMNGATTGLGNSTIFQLSGTYEIA
jgi:hypothetical protein